MGYTTPDPSAPVAASTGAAPAAHGTLAAQCATNTAEIMATEDAAQLPTYAKLPLAFVRGAGSYVWDADGTRWLDLYGGHCVALAGHCHPRLVAAIQEQAGRLIFYSNVAYSDVRALAAERVTALAPEGLRRVFFCNSGSEANETALKIARKHTGRKRVVSMREGFHGRTLGALGATGMQGFRDPAYPVPTEHDFVTYGALDELEDAIGPDVAAVLLEPIPSMGGISVAAPEYFRRLRALCDQHGAMLIFDEVQTGFGRTGTNFYGEQVGVTPDLITGAKGVAGGFPAGVVFVKETLAAKVKTGEQGTTFGGGPLASAAMATVAAILVEEDLAGNAARVGAALTEELQTIDGVLSVAGAGLLLGINLDRPAKPIVAALREHGVLTGTASGDPNQIRLLPPLNLSMEECDPFVLALAAVLS